jgi:hypothetical protein
MTQAQNVAELGSDVNSSGVLLPAGGGTGVTALTANNVMLGGTTVQFVAPGTTGNVLTSNGTTWTSAAAAAFDAGTILIFGQTSAPTGWTKLTNLDNYALRVVSGTAGTGGSVAFTTAFASQTPAGTVGSTTLTEAMMPSHTHTYSGTTGGAGAHTHDMSQLWNDGAYDSGATGFFLRTWSGGSPAAYASLYQVYTSNPGNHTHSFSGTTAGTGSSSGHNHSFTGTAINLAVQYVDVIRASKN